MAPLRLDFYESGVGDTIVITFPSGGIGLVDAHPSSNSKQRSDIRGIVGGKRVHFVCLTHPHEDHGADLVTVVREHPDIESFWHTIFDIPAFLYGISQTASFPSEMRQHAKELNAHWATFFIDLMHEVTQKEIPRHALRSDLLPSLIDGVEIHCVSPDESIQNEFFDAHKKKLLSPALDIPSPNLLSAILVLRFGVSVVVLGADALKKIGGPRSVTITPDNCRKRYLLKSRITVPRTRSTSRKTRLITSIYVPRHRQRKQ